MAHVFFADEDEDELRPLVARALTNLLQALSPPPPTPPSSSPSSSRPRSSSLSVLGALRRVWVKPPMSPFACTTPPPITVSAFADRLAEFLYASPTAFVVAHALVRRVHRANPALLAASCHHKLLLACCVVAAKFSDDKFYSNSYYAETGGVDAAVLVGLERELLRLLDHRVFVSASEFAAEVAIRELGGYYDNLALRECAGMGEACDAVSAMLNRDAMAP